MFDFDSKTSVRNFAFMVTLSMGSADKMGLSSSGAQTGTLPNTYGAIQGTASSLLWLRPVRPSTLPLPVCHLMVQHRTFGRLRRGEEAYKSEIVMNAPAMLVGDVEIRDMGVEEVKAASGDSKVDSSRASHQAISKLPILCANNIGGHKKPASKELRNPVDPFAAWLLRGMQRGCPPRRASISPDGRPRREPTREEGLLSGSGDGRISMPARQQGCR
ncbi:hypothetical protein GSI_14764 [Ganoderma sinense ZZ0214-1]|uniref:Uncharacterized protein n=1 Tax=Ganoderma sinense ZZ0214-1 TaxID=1077348 RepID=A0A2G8RPM4_9APHY|nr:hypothetical protein GSI_14764 [Ganoderma sinense ZZ0214-1]